MYRHLFENIVADFAPIFLKISSVDHLQKKM
jgi:hypothetical protein